MPARALTADGVEVFCAYDTIADINKLKPNPRNPNAHSDEQVALLARIIRQQGWRNCITVSDLSGYIVKGHGRLMAAQEAGFTEVPVEIQHYATESDELADLIADNRIAELSAMDKAQLAELFASIDLEKIEMTGYTEEEAQELQDLFADVELEEEMADDIVPAADFDNEPVTQAGDVWLLGKHKLICGDSTDGNTYKALLGDELAQMIVTDPPYNVDYTGKTADALKIKNDKMSNNGFLQFLTAAFKCMANACAPGAAVYVWHADSEGLNFRKAYMEAGLLLKQCLVWVKNVMVLGRQDYQWRHEPCLYGWAPGKAHYFINDRKQTTVQEYQDIDYSKLKKDELLEIIKELISPPCEQTTIYEKKPTKSALHPTMKPIKLFTRLIRNSSKLGWIVLDPFGGSGTTLIAAELTGRVGRCIELDPYYCDVIVRRYIQTCGGANVECLRGGKLATADAIARIFEEA